MKKIVALSFFMGACIIISTLLMTNIITIVAGALLFAISLVIFGGLSKGISTDKHPS